MDAGVGDVGIDGAAADIIVINKIVGSGKGRGGDVGVHRLRGGAGSPILQLVSQVGIVRPIHLSGGSRNIGDGNIRRGGTDRDGHLLDDNVIQVDTKAIIGQADELDLVGRARIGQCQGIVGPGGNIVGVGGQ